MCARVCAHVIGTIGVRAHVEQAIFDNDRHIPIIRLLAAQLMQWEAQSWADHVLPFSLIYSDYSCLHHGMSVSTPTLHAV